MLRREAGTPRSKYLYRGWRRNNSNLGVKGRDWFGVEAKMRKDPPPLVQRVSERGETHYVELW